MPRLPGPASTATLLLLLCTSLAVRPTAGQSQEDLWKVEGEVGASLFFGNTDQTTITTRVGTERADSAFEFSAEAGFNYGEATNEEGATFVNKRSWVVATSLDHRPFGVLSPFVFARTESSFEKRIALRYDAGAGGKLTLVRRDRDRADLSVALLAERTVPSDDVTDDGSVLLARWSTRLRLRRALADDRVTLTSETTYRPQVERMGNFTVSSRSSLAFQLTSIVSLRLTLLDNYDSQAVSRGARTNNDGQLVFSVLSSF